ncbi:hypothetical protein ON010_g15262 [Phytophthora cinnamomi]|nr:hypothetical protein ON010_g15262 [Phytophthora cinnamomi]
MAQAEVANGSKIQVQLGTARFQTADALLLRAASTPATGIFTIQMLQESFRRSLLCLVLHSRDAKGKSESRNGRNGLHDDPFQQQEAVAV